FNSHHSRQSAEIVSLLRKVTDGRAFPSTARPASEVAGVRAGDRRQAVLSAFRPATKFSGRERTLSPLGASPSTMVTKREARKTNRPEKLRPITSLKWIVGVGLAVSFLLAPGIWLKRQFFTPMPIADAIRPLPPPLDLMLLGTLLVLLAAV